MRINKFGWTALHAACYFGRLDIVQYLIEEEQANPNEVNPNGWHSLIFSVMGGNGFEVITYLLNLNLVNINYTDSSGKSALNYAESIYPGGKEVQVLFKACAA